MPTDLSDSVSGSTELVFPDDVGGKYRLRERSVYDAEEVREDLDGDVPQYGDWLPVEDNGEKAWLVAPSELRAELIDQEIRVNELFRIDEMTKTGRGQSDPYRVSVTLPERKTVDEDQASLSDA
jgi:hypothetical protein